MKKPATMKRDRWGKQTPRKLRSFSENCTGGVRQQKHLLAGDRVEREGVLKSPMKKKKKARKTEGKGRARWSSTERLLKRETNAR